MTSPVSADALDALFTPRSITIVGASDDPRRIGGRPLAHMIQQRFDGAVYPVNPKRDTAQGLRCYPSVSDIDDRLDFVLIAVPAPDVAPALRAAAAKGARTALIFSAGFAEIGDDGAAMQAELAEIARTTGVRVIGPNCLGLFNSAARFYPTFTSTIDRATPVPGGIAIASQSGAYGSHIYMVSHLRGLGIGYWATTGNEADLQVSELIGMMAAHDDVHAIMAYAESVKDGDGLRQSLEIARENRKPVIFMKVGRSEVGAAAASSHTASLAGEDAVYDAVLKEHGAYRVRSTEEMLDVAYAALPRIYPTGKRLGLVTISGGAGVLMADAASDCGLEVPPMPEDAQAEIREILPFAAPRNPVDVTAQFFNDLSLIPRFTKSMLDRGGYDGVVGFWTSVAGSPVLGEPLLAHLQETMAAYRDRLFLHCVIAPEEMRARYEQAGFPCFEDPTRAITAMAAMMRFGEAFARTPGAPPDPAAALPRPEGPLDERAAKRLLADAGLPMVEDVIVASAEEAQIAAVRFGGSVALKIASADILHKTDVGGVALNMKPEEAAAGFNRVMAACRAAVPSARIDGVLVSPMAPEGVDCIIGVKRDQVFGPVVLFGLGGVYAEVLRDVACRPGPVGVAAAREMIEEITGVELLKGARGAAPVDFDALAATLSRLSAIAAANADWIESVEINPLRALPKGCLALDALIIPREN